MSNETSHLVSETLPDEGGHFGPYGGRYVPETLMALLEDLAKAYRQAKVDPRFEDELDYYLREFVGRPGDEIDGGDLLPGFRLPLGKIFPADE